MEANVNESLIKKETIHPGKKYIPFKSGTKVKFHFETRRSDNQKVIDDSRKSKPMELVIGKKFKLEVWEVIVQKMALCEVARFEVDSSVSITLLEKFLGSRSKINQIILLSWFNNILLSVRQSEIQTKDLRKGDTAVEW